MDSLIRSTHQKDWPLDKDTRYTDTRLDEQERGVSIKATPMSLVLPTLKQKVTIRSTCPSFAFFMLIIALQSHLINIFDTPGHPNFADEQTACTPLLGGGFVLILADAALRLVDGVVVVIDVIEGVMLQTKRGLEHAVHASVPITVVLNKVSLAPAALCALH